MLTKCTVDCTTTTAEEMEDEWVGIELEFFEHFVDFLSQERQLVATEEEEQVGGGVANGDVTGMHVKRSIKCSDYSGEYLP